LGGAGTANSITGTSVTYAAGGRGATTGSASVANTGNGGDIANDNTATVDGAPYPGASGIVIIKWS
jgi:hypothetical protein